MTETKKAPETFGERATMVMDSSIIERPMHHKDIARHAKMNSRRVKSILVGLTRPDIDEAKAIALSLDVPVGYLITGDIEEDAEDQALASPDKVCGCGSEGFCPICDNSEVVPQFSTSTSA